jgi:hypothetical protein
MKLIVEELADVKFVTEQLDEATGKKNLYIEGIFMQGDLQNRNGRRYPMEVLQTEVNRYNKELVEKKRAFGELGHPQGPTVNLDRVSHMITELKADGSNIMGKAKIMDTPMGNIVTNLIGEGASLGVSSRGLGSLKTTKDGINEVQNDFHLATAADIVADPSAPDAFVEGIMEGREWIWDNGHLKTAQLEAVVEDIDHAAAARELHERKLEIFEKFLNSLSNK